MKKKDRNRHPEEDSLNSQATPGLRSELTATRRPSHSRKQVCGSIREQGQLTFNLEDSVPEAPRDLSHARKESKKAGGESGRTKFQSDNYWSSTENSATNAWNVNFSNCNVNNNNKTNTNYVRAVRGGKWQGCSSRETVKRAVSRDLSSVVRGEKEVFSFESIYSAYLKCRRRKRNTANALRFELNLEENIIDLQESLVNG